MKYIGYSGHFCNLETDQNASGECFANRLKGARGRTGRVWHESVFFFFRKVALKTRYNLFSCDIIFSSDLASPLVGI